jgi:hypothetical protein
MAGLSLGGERAVDHKGEPDARLAELRGHVLCGCVDLGGGKHIQAIDVRCGEQAVCVIAREGERLHRPIGGCSARPKLALLVEHARDQVSRRRGRVAANSLDEFGIPQMMQVAAGEPIPGNLFSVPPAS